MSSTNSIRAIGLRKYLNQTYTTHNGKHYFDFLEMIDNKAPQRYIARSFGVNKNTVAKWVEIHNEEQNASIKTAQ